MPRTDPEPIAIPLGPVTLQGDLTIPEGAHGLVPESLEGPHGPERLHEALDADRRLFVRSHGRNAPERCGQELSAKQTIVLAAP